MAISGSDVLLLANTGTDVAPVWTVVGSQRNVSFEETNEEIDVSSKDSRAMRVLAGRYGATATLEALYVPSDAAYQALKTAARNGDPIKIRRREIGTDTEEASAIITTLSGEFPDQDAGTISVELRIDGAWTAVP